MSHVTSSNGVLLVVNKHKVISYDGNRNVCKCKALCTDVG